ncbi:MAG: hypothetical protein A3K03_06425 [Bdellovibrionales bacterium RIFOXYD1_FULL_44_7]|nr:MAG: hypothetical protein A3K03_06425 [Bdellovibrionales bacterium RIFOXYD1_FULL_44_7]
MEGRLRSAALALVAISGILLFSSSAFCRDMQGRLGMGYSNEFSNGVPGVSLKYAFTRDIAVQGMLGFSTTSPLNSGTGLKLFKNIFYETNLNFYYMLGAGILTAKSTTAAEFITGFGTEFFIPGLESLGFMIETGAIFGNISGSFILHTLGVSFLNAGIHFYF